MNKKDAEDLGIHALIADILVRVKTMEKILIAKGIFTSQEFEEEHKNISFTLAKSILQKANVPGDLDQLINDLQGTNKKDGSTN